MRKVKQENDGFDKLMMGLNSMIDAQRIREKRSGKLFVITGLHEDGSLLLSCVSEPMNQAIKVSRLDGFEKA